MAFRIFEVVLWLIGVVVLSWPEFDLSLGYFSARDGWLFWSSLWGSLVNALIFYINALVLMPRYLAKGRKSKYLLSLTILFIGLSVFEVVLDFSLLTYNGKKIPILDGELVGIVFMFNTLFLLLSLGYGFFRIWFRDAQDKKELEREKLTSELNFLRSQINPHFLFNTLNNLFALSRKSGDYSTADQISRLAGIMRYMLYETNSEKVELSKEIDYIKNYIDLQRLRFQCTDPVKINCSWPDNSNSLQIAPFLLISFVENAFQHGISLTKPSLIDLQCVTEGGILYFELKNTVHKMNQKDVGGIGIENTRKRLALIYPGKHELKIVSGEELYHVQLKVDCQ